jgi:hypothetical protein
METLTVENVFGENAETGAVDEIIKYPCYKSVDEYIDVDRLRKLDGYLTERINRRIRKRAKEDFFLNLYRLEKDSPYQPGVREIWLSRVKTGKAYDYLDLDKTDLWSLTEEAEEFAQLLDFIRTLPFRETGRMIVIYDDAGKQVPAHRDHVETDICHEFIWFRTNLRKPFYMLNHLTGEKKYVEGYTAWFDSVNQYHGSDACDGLSFSIRVDGKFTDEFKRQIPKPKINPASRAALWACME